MITQRVLSETQIEQLREAALNHIERHGFVVQQEALLAKACARGARVDGENVTRHVRGPVAHSGFRRLAG